MECFSVSVKQAFYFPSLGILWLADGTRGKGTAGFWEM